MTEKSLNGIWSLRRLATGEVYPARVPGDITDDLFRAGVYADPLVSLNYKDCKWVLEEDFEYFTEFSVTEDMLKEECARLSFKGIDTFAEVFLNGEKIFDAQNMFLGYEKEVTKTLRAGNNLLSVVMRSTPKKAREFDSSAYFSCFNPYRIFLRKAQCHFGWDWAPELPGYGIWQDVTLTCGSAARVENVNYAAKTDGNVTLFATLALPEDGKKYALRYTLAKTADKGLDGDNFVYTVPADNIKNFAGFRIPSPKLWWCAGMGEPHLYGYRVELLSGGKVLSAKEGVLGIRETQIEEIPLSRDRLSFTLKLNGKKVYCKGSNWVPIECFTGTVKDEKYRELLQLVKDANMNTVRVWGGGIYEKDIFYDLCDRMGLMVWQDFMFACADIPEDNADFVRNALDDCTYNILRLRAHPSLVCWCGGNEKTGTYGRMISHGDYFLDHMLQGAVSTLDKSRPYFRQSPHGYTDVGNDSTSGETHGAAFGDLLDGSFRDYRKKLADTRISFHSEVAVMGPCEEKSYRAFLKSDELWPTNPVWDDRYRANPYAKIIRTFVDVQKQYAREMYGEFTGLSDFIAKSMAIHADALTMEIENARTQKWHSSGIMNWMLSDIWPTGTWSVVDYYLRPKQAYYAMKRAFRPLLPAFVRNAKGDFELRVCSDLTRPLALDFTFGQKTLSGEILWQNTKSLRLSANAAAKVALIRDGDIDKREDAYLFVRTDGDGTESNVCFPYLYPDPPFVSDYVCSEEREGDRATLTFRANAFARAVRILSSGDGAKFSDNYFDLEAGETKRITVTGLAAEDKLTVSDFAKETK